MGTFCCSELRAPPSGRRTGLSSAPGNWALSLAPPPAGTGAPAAPMLELRAGLLARELSSTLPGVKFANLNSNPLPLPPGPAGTLTLLAAKVLVLAFVAASEGLRLAAALTSGDAAPAPLGRLLPAGWCGCCGAICGMSWFCCIRYACATAACASSPVEHEGTFCHSSWSQHRIRQCSEQLWQERPQSGRTPCVANRFFTPCSYAVGKVWRGLEFSPRIIHQPSANSTRDAVLLIRPSSWPRGSSLYELKPRSEQRIEPKIIHTAPQKP